MQDLYAIRFLYDGKKKVSHDYSGKDIKTFSYRELWNVPGINVGIPCRQNNFVIIDVDVAGTTHQYDGREYWTNFMRDFGVPPTYTVVTPSGGFHFYFRLPASVNPETFSPPDELAKGVDVKWNGWVGAPPTPGYQIYYGDLTTVAECPPGLMAEFHRLRQGGATKTFDVTDPNAVLTLHRPFNEAQLKDIWLKIHWLQQNGTLSRAEWRDGIFALASGIEDQGILEQFITAWTMNKGYIQGDEVEAMAMAKRSDTHGKVGPGTIFKILNDVRIREGAPLAESPFTIQEILDRSKISKRIAKDGSLIVDPNESNAAAILGAIHDEKTLYHDVRSDLYIFKGKPVSEQELASLFLPMLQSPAFGLGLEKFRKGVVANGIDVLMATRKRDPHQDYLNSVAWDGVPRIETFFSRYVRAEDSAYTRQVGLNFWVALAARGLSPGCKFDSMVILEGGEGINKSSLVEAIGGQYTFAPIKKEFANDLDVLRQMHQAVVVELPELIGLVNQSAEFVKAFLAKPFDNIRGLFARKAMRNDRGFVFIGTTNSRKYLSAAMGARRFWPVYIPKGAIINLSGIRADRDQLFAEGIARFRDGHQYWYMPKELLAPVIEGKVVEDPLNGAIEEIVAGAGLTFTSIDVYRKLEASGYIGKGLTAGVTGRIEEALIRLGCERDGGVWRSERSRAAMMVADMAQVGHQAMTLGAFL